MSTRIGPYRVLRLINEGGQGGVFLGYDSRLHRRVAIKVHRLPKDRIGRKNLLREAQLVASIHSPKVVQIYDLVVSQDNVALIMEYVPGCDLEEFLTNSQPSIASVLTIATDLAAALAAARQQRIVHGDLKASNVLITELGRVKLSDFGIARSGLERTPGVSNPGSPACVSPEQYLGKPLDIRSDLFALGCLLYRMLTGSQPFVREGQLDPRRLLEERPPGVEDLVADLPAGLPELVNGLLQKAPIDRPQNTQQVRSALRGIARSIPLSVSGTLLLESQASFREESPGDTPPSIPIDLRRRGRSRLRPFRADEFWSWRSLSLQSAPLRLCLGLLIAVLAAIVVERKLPREATHIHIDTPVFRVSGDMSLPPEVSVPWLVAQVKDAAISRLGPIFVTGPVGASESRTRYATPVEFDVNEQLSVALRCSDNLCLLALGRIWKGRRENRQALLSSDMPVAEWRQTITATAQALYDL